MKDEFLSLQGFIYMDYIFEMTQYLSFSGKFSDTSSLKLIIFNRVANPGGKKLVTCQDIR